MPATPLGARIVLTSSKRSPTEEGSSYFETFYIPHDASGIFAIGICLGLGACEYVLGERGGLAVIIQGSCEVVEGKLECVTQDWIVEIARELKKKKENGVDEPV